MQPRCGAQPGRSLPASLMQVPFDLIGTAYAVLDQHSAQRLSEQYREADVALEVAVPTHRADALRAVECRCGRWWCLGAVPAVQHGL